MLRQLFPSYANGMASDRALWWGPLEPLPLAVALFYGLALVAPDASAVVVSVAFAMGMIVRRRTRWPAVSGQAEGVALAMVTFVLAALISYLANPMSAEGLAALARLAPVLLGIGVMFFHAEVEAAWAIWVGSSAGAVSAGLVAIFEVGIADLKRAEAQTSAILFGDLSLLLGVTAFAVYAALGRRTRFTASVSLAALALGLMASVLSGSRGSWLALPVLLGLLALRYRRSATLMQYAGVAVLVLATLAAAVMLGQGRAQARVVLAVKQFDAYAESLPGDDSRATSVGLRFEMWGAAIDAFREHPVLGLGVGNLQAYFEHEVRTGERAPRTASFRHAHNQYFTSLATGGIVGFLALVALLSVPGWYFARAFRTGNERARSLGTVGLLTVSGFAIFGLTEAIFESLLPITFYILTVGLLTSQLSWLVERERDLRQPKQVARP